MTMEEKNAKLVELVNNEQILSQIIASGSKDAMKSVFAQYGLDLTAEEIDAFVQMMNRSEDGELSMEEMENVAGGAIDALWVFSMAAKGIKAVAKKAWEAGKWAANHGF